MIDVVIPTCDNNLRLRLVLWGLEQQTNKDFIVHVIDNSINCATKSLIDNFTGDLQINYQVTPQHDSQYKPSYTRNIGISYCKSNRIIFINDDTVPDSTLIDEHHKSIDTTNIVVGSCKNIQESDIKWLYAKLDRNILTYNNFNNYSQQDDYRITTKRLMKSYLALSHNFVDTYPFSNSVRNACLCDSQNISYNSSIIKCLGGFCEFYDGWLYGEDHDLAIRAIRSDCAVVTIPNTYVYHLGHKPRAEENNEYLKELLDRTHTEPQLIRNNGPIT